MKIDCVSRSVYEGPEPTQFEERLEHRIKNHDREIERMCNYHYQGFIESVRGLLQVRTDVENLKVCMSLLALKVSLYNFTKHPLQ